MMALEKESNARVRKGVTTTDNETVRFVWEFVCREVS